MIYDWAVIGAGPAGIIAVGKLLDEGIQPNKILWVDPAFKVGDFGGKWSGIPSNTKVESFTRVLHRIQSFHFAAVADQFELTHLNPDHTCLLKLMALPLAYATTGLRKQVNSQEGKVDALFLRNGFWHLNIGEELRLSKKVILTIGAEPKVLDYAGIPSISLSIAMNPKLLAETCQHYKSVAVFGSSHSGILAIRHLAEIGMQRIVNFYRSPLCYALYLDGFIMYDDHGLKGTTADWAHAHIDHDTLPNLERYYADDASIDAHLKNCDAVIYAVGFERRSVKFLGYPAISYDRHVGIIAPGLFGFGIAFPEAYITPLGQMTHRVGLRKFLDYLERVLPIWMQYHT